MNAIYIPQTIKTAAQAEALPIGTVAMFPGEPSAAARVDYGCGWSIAADEMSYTHECMTGWTALVPTTTVHELAEQWANNSDRGWYSSFGDELLEVLAGRPHG